MLILPFLLCAAILALPDDALAARWHKKRVTYRLAVPNGNVQATVDAAAESWNLTRANVRLVRAKGPRADITIRLRDKLFDRYGLPAAGLGELPGDGHATTKLLSSLFTIPSYQPALREVQARAVSVAAHEFGHNLGLLHQPATACALMSPGRSTACVKPADRSQEICTATRLDRQKLLRLYRSSGRKNTYPSCDDLIARHFWPSIPYDVVIGSISLASALQISINGGPWQPSLSELTAPVGTAIRLRFRIARNGGGSKQNISIVTNVGGGQLGTLDGVQAVLDGLTTCSGNAINFAAEGCAAVGATPAIPTLRAWGAEAEYAAEPDAETWIVLQFTVGKSGSAQFQPVIKSAVAGSSVNVILGSVTLKVTD